MSLITQYKSLGYAENLTTAIETVGKLKEIRHQDCGIKHTPVRSYLAIAEHKDVYGHCSCTKELDLVEDVLEQSLSILKMAPLIEACSKSGLSIDLSRLNYDLPPLSDLNKKITALKFIRRVGIEPSGENVSLDDAKEIWNAYSKGERLPKWRLQEQLGL